jgi:hypothetical protein
LCPVGRQYQAAIGNLFAPGVAAMVGGSSALLLAAWVAEWSPAKAAEVVVDQTVDNAGNGQIAVYVSSLNEPINTVDRPHVINAVGVGPVVPAKGRWRTPLVEFGW